MQVKKKYYIILLFALVIFGANIQWTRSAARPESEPGPSFEKNKFIGSASCASCHKDIHDSYVKTAHYLDSRPAAAEFIKGSFDRKKNHFTYSRNMKVVLEKKKDQFFQTAYFNGTMLESEAFGMVIGSGRKGQTYLYWDSIRLFQLPISWYGPTDSWCNSPGYPTNLIYFNKQVHPQCMECHTTYARTEEQDNLGTVFDKSSILYGIDCERCHGPAAVHVTFHQSHPGETIGKYIINARRLSRQQRLDACALCHSGLRQPLRPSFVFRVGDSLDEFSTPGYNTDSVSSLDVHANQYGLLTSSKCFKMSQMDCSSCHNVHTSEVNSPAVFSQRCMNCHNEENHTSCTSAVVKSLSLSNNCIDCHMPRLPSGKILLQMSGSDTAAHDLVRTHRVGLYPDAVRVYMESRNQKILKK